MNDNITNLNEINKRLSASKRASWCPENIKYISNFYLDFNKRNNLLTMQLNVYVQWFNLIANRFAKGYGWDGLSMYLEPVSIKEQIVNENSQSNQGNSFDTGHENIQIKIQPIKIYSYLIQDISETPKKRLNTICTHPIKNIGQNGLDKSYYHEFSSMIVRNINNPLRIERIQYFISNERIKSRVIDVRYMEKADETSEINKLKNGEMVSEVLNTSVFNSNELHDYSKLVLASPSMISEHVVEKINGVNENKEFQDTKHALEVLDTSGFDSEKLHDYSRLVLASSSMTPEKIIEKVNELIKKSNNDVRKEMDNDVKDIKIQTRTTTSEIQKLSKAVPTIKSNVVEEVLKSMDKHKQNEIERRGYY